jgi:hypothetical protein
MHSCTDSEAISCRSRGRQWETPLISLERFGMPEDTTQQEVIRFNFEEGDELLNELNNGEGISPELAADMAEELSQIRCNLDSILMVATDGQHTITILMVPHTIIQEDGPVLVPSTQRHKIISMVSKEFVADQALLSEAIEDGDIAQKYWDDFLDGLYSATLDLGTHENRVILHIPDHPTS